MRKTLGLLALFIFSYFPLMASEIDHVLGGLKVVLVILALVALNMLILVLTLLRVASEKDSLSRFIYTFSGLSFLLTGGLYIHEDFSAPYLISFIFVLLCLLLTVLKDQKSKETH